jgi:hypothetical protein
MDLSPYLETLRADLLAAAAPGGASVEQAAALLGGSLEASARLALLEALSDAAAEITTRLTAASVEVRLHGRDADLVVTEAAPEPPAEFTPAGAAINLDSSDLSRLTLRMPEALKERVEQLAGAQGVSVNAWLVRAVATAAGAAEPPSAGAPMSAHQAATQRRSSKRITGWAQS